MPEFILYAFHSAYRRLLWRDLHPDQMLMEAFFKVSPRSPCHGLASREQPARCGSRARLQRLPEWTVPAFCVARTVLVRSSIAWKSFHCGSRCLEDIWRAVFKPKEKFWLSPLDFCNIIVWVHSFMTLSCSVLVSLGLHLFLGEYRQAYMLLNVLLKQNVIGTQAISFFKRLHKGIMLWELEVHHNNQWCVIIR